MKINIIGRRMEVDESLKQLIAKKLTKFDKFFKDDAVAYVTLSHEKNAERLELTVSSGGTLFRSEERNSTFNNALDTALDTIERQIRKYKTRLEKRLREGAFRTVEIPPEEHEEEFAIREKSFVMKPMTPEEAILQMNLIGHAFYMFENSETGSAAVVYKRQNGGYGLLLPEK
ncbi:MAG: ribosome-associated translation inhibitor RaiA [Ruminococcaceae bacterium]|nr:ribosome-associated translation inhibitor RaiA [Oscillospiraceae bacterium]